jgi:hypothetical protein
MPNITGVRGTGNIPANQIKVEVAPELALLDVNRYPLVALLSNAGKDPFTKEGVAVKKKLTHNPKFTWWEDKYGEVWDAINCGAGYAAGITDWVVDNAAYFTKYDVVKVPRTGETVLVTAINTGTNTLTVTRSIGSVAAEALVDDDPLLIIGSAAEEGSRSREVNTTQAVENYNHCQIFKTTIGATETLKQTDLYTGADIETQRKKKGIEHMVSIERGFLFGERAIDTSGSHPRRYTGGVLERINTNIQDESASTLTEAEFEAFLEMLFAHGSTSKYLFASAKVLSAINLWARGKLQMLPSDKTYGINITRYLSAHGELLVIKHPLLEGAIYGGMAVGLDVETLGYRFLRNRDTFLKTNVQDNDEDAEKDQYISEVGLEMKQEERSALLKGVTGGA